MKDEVQFLGMESEKEKLKENKLEKCDETPSHESPFQPLVLKQNLLLISLTLPPFPWVPLNLKISTLLIYFLSLIWLSRRVKQSALK